MTCPQGHENPVGSVFCNACGVQLAAEPPVEEPVPDVDARIPDFIKPPTSDEAEAAYALYEGQHAAAIEPPDTVNPSPRPRPPWLIPGLAFAGAAIVIIIVVAMISNAITEQREAEASAAAASSSAAAAASASAAAASASAAALQAALEKGSQALMELHTAATTAGLSCPSWKVETPDAEEVSTYGIVGRGGCFSDEAGDEEIALLEALDGSKSRTAYANMLKSSYQNNGTKQPKYLLLSVFWAIASGSHSDLVNLQASLGGEVSLVYEGAVTASSLASTNGLSCGSLDDSFAVEGSITAGHCISGTNIATFTSAESRKNALKMCRTTVGGFFDSYMGESDGVYWLICTYAGDDDPGMADRLGGSLYSSECITLDFSIPPGSSVRDSAFRIADMSMVSEYGNQDRSWLDACPQWLDAVNLAARAFRGGSRSVGDGSNHTLVPGTYSTAPGRSNCYWERTTPDGDTIDNNFVTHAADGITVTISPSDGSFTSNNCGVWLPV